MIIENENTKLYYSIGEVAKIVELKQYVLRYWETEFPSLRPNKNRSGNRTYRQKDIDIIKEIKHLLYDKKFTIVGARQYFKTNKMEPKSILKVEKMLDNNSDDLKTLEDLKKGLDDLLNYIRNNR
jgi:DNA-binding transcriptional MerR regulator